MHLKPSGSIVNDQQGISVSSSYYLHEIKSAQKPKGCFAVMEEKRALRSSLLPWCPAKDSHLIKVPLDALVGITATEAGTGPCEALPASLPPAGSIK